MARKIVFHGAGQGMTQCLTPVAELFFLPGGLLNAHGGKVDGFRENPRRRSGFKPPDPEMELFTQSCRKGI